MRIAIVGSGISGLSAAYLLHADHEITLFEADDRAGGHTHTVPVELDGESHAVDTGFIVFNERNYPNFVRLLGRLGVRSHETTMSFSVRCDRTGLEYNGTSINRLFAQRRNLVNPGFYRMLRDILRFNREAAAVLEGGRGSTTVGEYVTENRYSEAFTERYLIPMGAAIWSAPPGSFRDFPIRFVVEFFRNHSLLGLRGHPVWRVIDGGSFRYVEALTRGFRDRIRTGWPVRSVTRLPDRVNVTAGANQVEPFDHVVLACHADQALQVLTDASDRERELLEAFPYQPNDVVLHTDVSALPKRRLAWGSWNYRIRRERTDRVTLTYDMNMLQGLNASRVFCVTLNEDGLVSPAHVIRRLTYHHPLFTSTRAAAQKRHAEVINVNRTSFCGAYWGYGFHEDGLASALRVCRPLGGTL